MKSLVHTVRHDSRVIMYFSSMKNAKNNAKKRKKNEKKKEHIFFVYKIQIVDDKNKQTPLVLTQLWFAVEVQVRVIEWPK